MVKRNRGDVEFQTKVIGGAIGQEGKLGSGADVSSQLKRFLDNRIDSCAGWHEPSDRNAGMGGASAVTGLCGDQSINPCWRRTLEGIAADEAAAGSIGEHNASAARNVEVVRYCDRLRRAGEQSLSPEGEVHACIRCMDAMEDVFGDR